MTWYLLDRFMDFQRDSAKRLIRRIIIVKHSAEVITNRHFDRYGLVAALTWIIFVKYSNLYVTSKYTDRI